MPGLVTIIMPRYDVGIAKTIDSMAEAMFHEKFYKKEIFSNPLLPVVAARVHLNIVNKNPQPISNKDKTVFVMMDGELHSRDELKIKKILSKNQLQDPCDAELILHLYEEYGDDFVSDLNGWFLILIHDVRKGKTLIINDRYGIYRSYYAVYNNVFIIASEIKCLLRFNDIIQRISERSVAEYFTYNAVLEDRTMFDNIYRLPPATIWTYYNGSVNKKQYFDICKHNINNSMTETDFLEQGNDILKKIIPRYFSGDGVGLSLTGGWDTRSQIAVMDRVEKTIPCYTFSGLYRKNLDSITAASVAGLWGQPHNVIDIGSDFLENFRDYAYRTIYVSDGTADIFKSHEVYLNEIARTIAPVRVTGKYGSQILGSIFGLKKQKIEQNIYSRDFLSEIQNIEQYTFNSNSIGSMFNDIRWFWIGFLAVEMSQVVIRTPFMDNDLIEFLYQVPMQFLKNSKLQKYVIKKNNPQLALIPSDKGKFIDSDHFYNKVHEQHINFIIKLDKAYNWHNIPHALVRLEPFWNLVGLHKFFMGCNQLVNYRLWLKNELQGFAKEILLDELTLSRPYFKRQFILKMVSDHFGNRANYTNEIGRIISFEIWHRLFIDQQSVNK